jgi:hypothetical protein
METIPKDKIQNLTNIAYSMITDITSIENSLNNISVIIGRGGTTKAYQQGTTSSLSTAKPEEKNDNLNVSNIPNMPSMLTRSAKNINEEQYTTQFEAEEETKKKTSEDLKKELEKLNSMTLIPSKGIGLKGGGENEQIDESQYRIENGQKINPNLTKELGELESRFGTKQQKSKNFSEEEEKVETETAEPKSTGTTNPMEALLRLINEKKSISVSDAAKTLNFDTYLIETWAKLLSDNNKIKLEYKLVGNPVLKAK